MMTILIASAWSGLSAGAAQDAWSDGRRRAACLWAALATACLLYAGWQSYREMAASVRMAEYSQRVGFNEGFKIGCMWGDAARERGVAE